MSRLMQMAAAVKEFPTLGETDEMLLELATMRRTSKVSDLIDMLLEYRALLREDDSIASMIDKPAREA